MKVLTSRYGLPFIDKNNKQHAIYQAIARYARRKRQKDFTVGNVSLDIFIAAAAARAVRQVEAE